MNLLNNIKIWKPRGTGSTAATITPASTFIDMSNWDGCLFLIISGSSFFASTGTVVLMNSSAASTGAGVLASTYSQKLKLGSTNRICAIDVVRPLKRYLHLNTLTCTGMIVLPITYKGRLFGSTQDLSYVLPTTNQPTGVVPVTTDW